MGKKFSYNYQRDFWTEDMLDAEFFTRMDIAEYVVEQFQFNNNDTIKVLQRNNVYLNKGKVLYVAIQYYDDDEIAKKFLTL